jgi:hypothetical protein
MGFMDKAKKLADQAQTKLDEVQKQFNEGQASSSNQASAGPPPVEYDQHGRPVAQPSDAAHTAATPQQGDALADAPPPPAPPAEKTPHVAESPGDSHTQGDPLTDSAASSPKPPAPPSGGAGLSSGDPLAG